MIKELSLLAYYEPKSKTYKKSQKLDNTANSNDRTRISLNGSNEYNTNSSRKKRSQSGRAKAVLNAKISQLNNLRNIDKENTDFLFINYDPTIESNPKYKQSVIKSKNNINNLNEMINDIKENGFKKNEKEYEEKLILKTKLEERIEALKNKILSLQAHEKNLIKTKIKNGKKNNGKEKVNERYSNLSEAVFNYENEIPVLREQIEQIKEDTLNVNTFILNENNQIEILKENVGKMNKLISEKMKEKDNFRPAMILMRKHIDSVKLKIENLEIQKKDFLANVKEFRTKKVIKGN